MLEYQFRPLEQWNGPKHRPRKAAAFRVRWSQTLDLLETELRHLRAKSVVLEIDIQSQELRQDGQLRAHVKPVSPRVRLSFSSSKGPLSFPCDTYDDWQDNVRAIALALECLRAVDRYGVTRNAEQYQGWAKLPEPKRTMNYSDYLAQLSSLCGWNIDSVRADLAGAVKAARVKWHPDRHGGDERQAREVNRVAQNLGVM